MAINPYVGCEHGCGYCFARFIKRFTGHTESWGTFVDARVNIAEVLAKQMKNPKFKGERIFLSSVTDPYQPIEKKYQLTRRILEVLVNYDNPVSIMTKSALILRDLDLIKKLKNPDINFTITTFDEKWRKAVEPNSSATEEKLEAMRKLGEAGICLMVMIGPYWPKFTDIEKMMHKFKELGVSHVFAESFNSIGGNWTGVEKAMAKDYPKMLPEMKNLIFDKDKFNQFYIDARKKLEKISEDLKIPTTIYFASGHAANKFK
jgi:DNA repair photolyase